MLPAATINPIIMGDPRAIDISTPTRTTLLRAVRDMDNHGGWREFYDRYARVIHDAARSQGLSEAEAQDVVQETLLSVVRTMPDFQYDPARCSFKTWLLHLTKCRIADHFRRLPPHRLMHQTRCDVEPRTSTMDRIPDSSESDLNAVWDDEWRNNLLDLALDRFKSQVSPIHFQVFYLLMLKRATARQVANALKVNLGLVYLVRHRLTPKFKRLIVALKHEIGDR
jgi:RNA polymerase sigma factor (sigma-70 family)